METEMMSHEECLHFLNTKEYRIWGIERFLIFGKNYKPDMDGILDFSMNGNKIEMEIEKTIFLSKKFLEQYGKTEKEVFSIVYE